MMNGNDDEWLQAYPNMFMLPNWMLDIGEFESLYHFVSAFLWSDVFGFEPLLKSPAEKCIFKNLSGLFGSDKLFFCLNCLYSVLQNAAA